MKKQIIAAVVLSFIPAIAFAAAAAPGFYIGTRHISPANIQQTVRNYGANAIRFMPPPSTNVPVKISTACGPFKYTFIYVPSPRGRHQIWQNTNGKAMSEKIINSCQRGPLTISFFPIVKK